MSKFTVSGVVNATIALLIVIVVSLFLFGGRDGALARMRWNAARDRNAATAGVGEAKTPVAVAPVAAKIAENADATENAAVVESKTPILNAELVFDASEFEPVASDIETADEELVFDASEFEPVASDVETADEELVFDASEIEPVASDIETADEEIVFDASEFEPVVSDIETADEEIVFDASELEPVVSELETADEEIVFDASEFEPVVSELETADEELVFDASEFEPVASELEAADEELVFDASEFEPVAANDETPDAEPVESTAPRSNGETAFDEADAIAASAANDSEPAVATAETNPAVAESAEPPLFDSDEWFATQVVDKSSRGTLQESDAADAFAAPADTEETTDAEEAPEIDAATQNVASDESDVPPCSPIAHDDAVAFATSDETVRAVESAQASESIATNDELWIAGANGNAFYFWRFDGAGWRAETSENFFATDDPSRATIVWVHGYQTDMNAAASEAFAFRAVLDGARRVAPTRRAYRLVVWKWASERSPQRLRKDAKMKAAFADCDGLNLARLIDGLNPSTDVALVGFSFGARVVGAALQTLATTRGAAVGAEAEGFAVSGGAVAVARPLIEASSFAPYADEAVDARPAEKGRLSLILVSAGCDFNAFDRGGAYGAGAALATGAANVYNPRDFALKFYPCAAETRLPALGVLPIRAQTFPNARTAPTNIDVETVLGKRHAFADAIRCVPANVLNELALFTGDR